MEGIISLTSSTITDTTPLLGKNGETEGAGSGSRGDRGYKRSHHDESKGKSVKKRTWDFKQAVKEKRCFDYRAP